MIEVGNRLPDAKFSLLDGLDMTHPMTDDLFAGKKVVLFAVPGAFTPTCSVSHLPGYVALADKLKEKGIDSIICLSVNDAFVMDAWGKTQNAEHVTMLADGNGAFTQEIGLDMDTDAFGGLRSIRYSMLVIDSVVEMLNIEEPGKFEVSDAQSMLDALPNLTLQLQKEAV